MRIVSRLRFSLAVALFILSLSLSVGSHVAQAESWQPAFYRCGPVHDPARCPSLNEGGFEGYTNPNLNQSGIWRGYGPDAKGIDINYGQAFAGKNNGWLRNSTKNWNSIYQFLTIQPGYQYRLHVFLRATPNVKNGYFTVRAGSSVTTPIITEQQIAGNGTYNEYVLSFNSGNLDHITIYAGFWGVGADAWMQMDNFYLEFLY